MIYHDDKQALWRMFMPVAELIAVSSFVFMLVVIAFVATHP